MHKSAWAFELTSPRTPRAQVLISACAGSRLFLERLLGKEVGVLELALDCAGAANPKLRLYSATLARLCLEKDPESFPLKGGNSIESRKNHQKYEKISTFSSLSQTS